MELCDYVLSDYYGTRASISDIAQINKVSATTVSKILDGKYFIKLERVRDGRICEVRLYWDDEHNAIFGSIGGVRRSIKWFNRHYRDTK